MPQPDLTSGTVRKPLPADRFVVHDTNVEMRWDAVSADAPLTPQVNQPLQLGFSFGEPKAA